MSLRTVYSILQRVYLKMEKIPATVHYFRAILSEMMVMSWQRSLAFRDRTRTERRELASLLRLIDHASCMNLTIIHSGTPSNMVYKKKTKTKPAVIRRVKNDENLIVKLTFTPSFSPVNSSAHFPIHFWKQSCKSFFRVGYLQISILRFRFGEGRSGRH